MQINGVLKEIKIGPGLKPELVINTNKVSESIEKLKDKKLVITLEEKKEKRSLNANRYYWSLINILKDIMGLSTTKMHEKMLYDYGQTTYVRVRKETKHVIEQGVKYWEIINEDDESIEYLILLGSSEMNTAQFSNLLNGVIQECEQQGIRTLEVEEIEKMIEEWSRENVK